jgi:hypothetical protein
VDVEYSLGIRRLGKTKVGETLEDVSFFFFFLIHCYLPLAP